MKKIKCSRMKAWVMKTSCIGILMIAAVGFTACGPSQDKIAEAQTKYGILIEKHNKLVADHKEIADDSLDEELTSLSASVNQLQEYNLAELKDDEIDEIIAQMEALSSEYDKEIAAVSKIKSKEDSLIRTDVSLTVKNGSSKTFSSLYLYEKGSKDQETNLLEEIGEQVPGETLTGLIIREDMKHTPWIMSLEDTDGVIYEVEIDATTKVEDRLDLVLSYDEATGTMAIAELVEENTEEAAEDSTEDSTATIETTTE